MARAAICTAACLLLCACSGAAARRSEQEDSLSRSELQAEVILFVDAGRDAADPCTETLTKLAAAGGALAISFAGNQHPLPFPGGAYYATCLPCIK